MREMLPYALLCLTSTFVASISQVMLKKAALKKYDNILKEYLNPLVIGAYVLFFGTTVLSLLAYKGLPVSLGQVFETTGYLYITLFGVLIFKEKLTAKRVIALLLIVVGIVVFAFG